MRTKYNSILLLLPSQLWFNSVNDESTLFRQDIYIYYKILFCDNGLSVRVMYTISTVHNTVHRQIKTTQF